MSGRNNNSPVHGALKLLILTSTILYSVQCVLSHQPSPRKNHTSPRSALHLPAVERARKFRCTEPQPRAYHLKDLMDSQGLLESNETPNLPAYLVIRRCDGYSGCCASPEMMCMPLEDSIEHEELDVQFWSVNTKKFTFKRITVEQHHNCSCEPANNTEREALESKRPRITLVS
ncbi:uncharacterized protein LOC130669330 [Microplitis mediator]|uniref:uncharacterized protein LOC130669330 n=1 Tax=Microplitis mediator TaxID=375433 RepID=UPI002556F513|nr:uncharacterized protein LOC130669330 [Microplitis mediator]